MNFLITQADPGVMGGKVSEEFMVPTESGEDIVLYCSHCQFANSNIEELAKCPKCNKRLKKLNTIEVGHIFQLGTKYSKIFQANFLNQQGNQSSIIMGCYGIGVSRLIPAIIEQNHDQNGIIWPWEVAPFGIIILPLEVADKKIYEVAFGIYNNLKQNGLEVILDDRDERAGVKFKDADLVGIPFQIIIGERFLKEDKIELKIRKTGERIVLDKKKLLEQIDKYQRR